MTCEDYQKLMMGLIDDELDPEDRHRLEKHLETCETCRIELERFQMLKEVTDEMLVKTPEDQFWDGYWSGIYNRLERGLGWLLMGAGAVVLLVGALVWGVTTFLSDPTIPLFVRIGIPILLAGVAVLSVSAIRERLRAYKQERYRDIRR